MKKFRILLSFLILFVGTTSAQTPLKLAFQTIDGSISSINAKSLSISVSGDNLTASNGTENLTFKLQELAKMYFTGDASGVELIPVNINKGEVSVYTLDGKFAGKFESAASAMSSLTRGIYIVKTSDKKSLKIAVQ